MNSPNVHRPHLANTDDSNKHPFSMPSIEDLDNIYIGQYIKVYNYTEYILCKITNIRENYVTAKIIRHLVGKYKYGYDSLLILHKNNIYKLL
jgi:hypothetical protein